MLGVLQPVQVSTPLLMCVGLLVLYPAKGYAQMQADKEIARVGLWQISTALFGVGCVAELDYDSQGGVLTLSGESSDELTLLITIDRGSFNTALDGSQVDIGNIEVALNKKRWSQIEPYGYRGTSGVVLKIGKDFLENFAASKKIKLTERGHEKLSIELGESRSVLKKLFDCFDAQ